MWWGVATVVGGPAGLGAGPERCARCECENEWGGPCPVWLGQGGHQPVVGSGHLEADVDLEKPVEA